MIICGDEELVHRLAQELDAVYGEAVTVVLPSRRGGHGADVVALHRAPHSPVELLISARPDEQTLRAAGVERAATLALTYGDDQMNRTAAPLARSINPSVHLVIRMVNRDRGRHPERLLDRAAAAYTRADRGFRGPGRTTARRGVRHERHPGLPHGIGQPRTRYEPARPHRPGRSRQDRHARPGTAVHHRPQGRGHRAGSAGPGGALARELGVYGDDFAATVSRTMRAGSPDALTRSRSVSALAAPSFAAAMMGRHVLGVMPVERGSLLFNGSCGTTTESCW
ncbi:NAD-binding protein [Streptomyces sp. NPDC085665]|uniref:NAD-binding protein n=1 Tax=Streptomyces sp. NPDC085665 TaxID=3365735 RepID=UPI0037D37F94